MISTAAAFVLYLILLLHGVQSFVVHPGRRVSILTNGARNTELQAKKRRKRKEPLPSDEGVTDVPTSGGEVSSNLPGSDLPDFDLSEESADEPVVPEEPMMEAVQQMAPVSDPAPPAMDFNQITEGMMGSSRPLSSIDELLADRSLEKLIQEPEPDPDVPDFAEFLQRKREDGESIKFVNDEILPPPGMGRKRARQLARQEAAIAKQKAEEEANAGNFLTNLPFLLNEKGEFSFVKLLETGAWIGIGLLVLWEVYINSPFFERAAPLTPIVFENPPGFDATTAPPPEAVGGPMVPPSP